MTPKTDDDGSLTKNRHTADVSTPMLTIFFFVLQIEADWKRKLESKNKQIKTLQDNNRYLKIRVKNLQTVCTRLKQLLTKKMAQEY